VGKNPNWGKKASNLSGEQGVKEASEKNRFKKFHLGKNSSLNLRGQIKSSEKFSPLKKGQIGF